MTKSFKCSRSLNAVNRSIVLLFPKIMSSFRSANYIGESFHFNVIVLTNGSGPPTRERDLPSGENIAGPI